MVITDTIEGMIDGNIWFHYDISDDVLYLRLADRHDAAGIGEETPDGFIVLRDEETDGVIGLTVVHWWRRFGRGRLPDSLATLQAAIEPWAGKVSA
jgi:hypothetical protein